MHWHVVAAALVTANFATGAVQSNFAITQAENLHNPNAVYGGFVMNVSSTITGNRSDHRWGAGWVVDLDFINVGACRGVWGELA